MFESSSDGETRSRESSSPLSNRLAGSFGWKQLSDEAIVSDTLLTEIEKTAREKDDCAVSVGTQRGLKPTTVRSGVDLYRSSSTGNS